MLAKRSGSGPGAGVHDGQRRTAPRSTTRRWPGGRGCWRTRPGTPRVRLLPRAGDAPALRTGLRHGRGRGCRDPASYNVVRGAWRGSRTAATGSPTSASRRRPSCLIHPRGGKVPPWHRPARHPCSSRPTAVRCRSSTRDDGTLEPSRGGGGLVSGLSGLGSDDVLWVCAALSDGDRAAARQAPDGRLDLRRARHRRHGGPDARHRPGHLPPGLQRGRQLDAVVRPPPALRDAEHAALRRRLPARVAVLRGVQRRRSPTRSPRRPPRAPRCWCRTTT